MKRVVSGLVAVLLMLSLAACGGGDRAGVTPDMESVLVSMAELLPEAAPFQVESVFDAYGLQPDDCKQEVVISYYDGSRTAELWLIEAVDEQAMQRVHALAQERLGSMSAQFRTYDAVAYALTEDAELFTHGNCVVMIVSENVQSLLEIYQTAAQLI